MKAPLSAFAIVGLLAIVALLGQHSRMLMHERDAANKAATIASMERDAARTHEQELQTALVAGEKNMRAYVEQHEKAVEDLKNAKPNTCTDAPVAPDVDRILRDAAAANLGYMPGAGKRTDTARYPQVERRDEQRLGGVLLEGPARCASV